MSATSSSVSRHRAARKSKTPRNDSASHGQRYIFLRQTVGRGTHPFAHKPTLKLENLSAGATVKISIHGANNLGKSAITGPVEVAL